MSNHAEIQKPIATGVTEPWVWLTDEEMVECAKYADKQDRREDWYVTFARAVQRKSKEKNT